MDEELLQCLQQAMLDVGDVDALNALVRALRRRGLFGGERRGSGDVFIRTLDGRIASFSSYVLCVAYNSMVVLSPPPGAQTEDVLLCVARDRAHALEIIDWVGTQIELGVSLVDLRRAPTREIEDRRWPTP